MLTISLCLDKEAVTACCKALRRPYSHGFYLYRAEDRGRVLAQALFEVTRDRVQVLFYEAEDPGDNALFDGVLRAGLNYAAQQGIENGLIPEAFQEAHRPLFARLNYPAIFNITNFFHKYKQCRPQS